MSTCFVIFCNVPQSLHKTKAISCPACKNLLSFLLQGEMHHSAYSCFISCLQRGRRGEMSGVYHCLPSLDILDLFRYVVIHCDAPLNGSYYLAISFVAAPSPRFDRLAAHIPSSRRGYKACNVFLYHDLTGSTSDFTPPMASNNYSRPLHVGVVLTDA